MVEFRANHGYRRVSDGYHSSNCGDATGYDMGYTGIYSSPKIHQIVFPLHIQDLTSGTTSQAYPQQILLLLLVVTHRLAVTPLAQWLQSVFFVLFSQLIPISISLGIRVFLVFGETRTWWLQPPIQQGGLKPQRLALRRDREALRGFWYRWGTVVDGSF